MMRSDPKPNDPCPCGSGRKYKKCCRARDRLDRLRGRTAGPDSAAALRVPTVTKGRVGPPRPVPDSIIRPDYAVTGQPGGGHYPLVKSPAAIDGMRAACRAARRVLETTKAAVGVGVSTDELDAVAHAAYLAEGGYPSCLNYHHFPKSICTSVNEVICHGIPDSRPLAAGDIVNIDVTIYLGGFHGDCSETVAVGDIDDGSRRLLEVTRECLRRGIAAVEPGSRNFAIGKAIQAHAEAQGYGVVRAFVGHGIGETFHMKPQVPHYYDRRMRERLRPGMTFTIEPMINQGGYHHRLWEEDGWTAVTEDLRRSAQFEHTVLVTEEGVEVLTRGEDEPAL